MARRYTESDLADIAAQLAIYQTAKETPETWLGTKAPNGGAWSGTITDARRTYENLVSCPPDNLTETDVANGWREAVQKLGEIING